MAVSCVLSYVKENHFKHYEFGKVPPNSEATALTSYRHGKERYQALTHRITNKCEVVQTLDTQLALVEELFWNQLIASRCSAVH